MGKMRRLVCIIVSLAILAACKNSEKAARQNSNTPPSEKQTETADNSSNSSSEEGKNMPENTINESALPEETKQIMEDKFTKLGFVRGVVTDYSAKSEGCKYMIETEKNGEKIVLLPQNLEAQYQKDGLKVWVKYRPIKPYVIDCKIGIPAYIEAVQPVK
ncbi:MAG: hypothetical protein D6707_10205 [Bacteroidetes bacterium]|nr:MAG: hypothetical protein D6707_10205 [Bacteroidota bacterium]